MVMRGRADGGQALATNAAGARDDACSRRPQTGTRARFVIIIIIIVVIQIIVVVVRTAIRMAGSSRQELGQLATKIREGQAGGGTGADGVASQGRFHGMAAAGGGGARRRRCRCSRSHHSRRTSRDRSRRGASRCRQSTEDRCPTQLELVVLSAVVVPVIDSGDGVAETDVHETRFRSGASTLR